MLRKSALILISLCACLHLQAQDSTVTLDYCLEAAKTNHPLFDQYDLVSAGSELKMKNYNKNYLPELNINGDIHYQSEVTEVPTAIAAFAPEPLDKDQYRISLDISQIIYDGGITKKNKDIEFIDNQINLQNVGVDLYRLNERVVGVYFSIVSLQESLALLEITRKNIEARLGEVESGVKNGMVLSSNSDILKAELLKIDQKEIEIMAGIGSGYKILSILTGVDILPDTRLQWNDPVVESFAPGRDRPEYALFSLQQQKTESLKKLASSKLVPRMIAYGQAGYGRPGFNMLLNEFDDYYIVGAKLSWNIWNWNKTHNEKSILSLQKEMIDKNRESFDQSLAADLEKKMAEIMKIEALIPKDEEIVNLRERIVETYASRLNNGVITSTEYITELHAELEARLNQKIHEIQLARAKYEYLATAGKL